MENPLICSNEPVNSTNLLLAFSLHEAAAHLNGKMGQELGTLYLLQLSAGLALRHLVQHSGTCVYGSDKLESLFYRVAAGYPIAGMFWDNGALYQKLMHTNVMKPRQGFHISTDELDELILCTAGLLDFVENEVSGISPGQEGEFER